MSKLFFSTVLFVFVWCCVFKVGGKHTEVDSKLTDCPEIEKGTYGQWEQDVKNGRRCILRCNDGYVPDKCHVIRLNENGEWTHAPRCVKASMISMSTACKAAVGVVAGTAAVASAPVALCAAGFTTAGVAAGSVAATLQGATTAAGGWFAALQSAGAAGVGLGANAGIFTTVSGAFSAASSYLCDPTCEAE